MARKAPKQTIHNNATAEDKAIDAAPARTPSLDALDAAVAAAQVAEVEAAHARAERKAKTKPERSPRGPTTADLIVQIVGRGITTTAGIVAALRLLKPEVGKGATGLDATAAGEAAARAVREAGASPEEQEAAHAKAAHETQAKASFSAAIATTAKAGLIKRTAPGCYAPADTTEVAKAG
jgi:hypothetical protein